MEYELAQVATLDDALLVPRLVAEGYTTGKEIADRLRMEPRQGDYRAQAGRLLGVIEVVPRTNPRRFRLTTLGATYLAASPQVQASMKAQMLLRYPACAALLELVGRNPIGVTKQEAIAAFHRLKTTTPSLETLAWRVPSLLGWVIAAGLVVLDGTRYLLTEAGKSAALAQGSTPALRPQPGKVHGIVEAIQRRVQDGELRTRIEIAAVEAAARWYREAGREVRSRESENLGWDLDVSGAGLPPLKVEVKGTSQPTAIVVLTANEYGAARGNVPDYRVLIVTNALGPVPVVREFYYDSNTDAWTSLAGEVLKHLEIIGLRLSD